MLPVRIYELRHNKCKTVIPSSIHAAFWNLNYNFCRNWVPCGVFERDSNKWNISTKREKTKLPKNCLLAHRAILRFWFIGLASLSCSARKQSSIKISFSELYSFYSFICALSVVTIVAKHLNLSSFLKELTVCIPIMISFLHSVREIWTQSFLSIEL